MKCALLVSVYLIMSITSILHANTLPGTSQLTLSIEQDSILITIENDHQISQRKIASASIRTKIEALTQNASNMYHQTLEEGLQSYIHNASELYEQILRPHQDQLRKKIAISAEGYLTTIPWDGLVTSTFPLRYMIYDHEIRIITEKKELRRSPNNHNGERRDIVALHPIYGEDLSIQNNAEVMKITSLFDSELLISGANSNSILDQLEHTPADIIHISGHSLPSGILLDNAVDTITTSELQRISIDSKLCFVNSCYSGIANNVLGYKSNLAQAFIDAGAKSAIGNLWQVNDIAATEISISTYEQICGGMSNTEALRYAKLAMIEHPTLRSHSHPYFWAGYYVMGEEVSFDYETSAHPKRYLSYLLSLLTILSIFKSYISAVFMKVLNRNVI